MRDILFRGKSLYGRKEWVYGLPVPIKYNSYMTDRIEMVKSHEYDELDNFNLLSEDDEVDPETVGQYTGLRDKNGVPIFEGDILYDPRWVVTYCADTHESLGMNAGWYIQRDNFESWMELENKPYYEVIGNIYDNPELLNE